MTDFMRDRLRRLARVDFLEGHLANRRNNFTAIRLALATFVLFGHSFPLAPWHGQTLAPPLQRFIGRGDWIGSLAVNGFFFISGMLIVRSYFLRRDLHAFMKARVLRIFPGYLVSLVLCVWVIGPIFSSLRAGAYLTDPETARIFFKDVFLWRLDHFLPGLFGNLPNHAVNGSWWTLPAEWRCYLVVGAFGLVGAFDRRWTTNLLLAIFAAYAFLSYDSLPLLSDHPGYPPLVAYFAAGAFCFANARFIPLSPLLLIPVWGAFYITFWWGTHIWFTGLLLCYAILILAYRSPPVDLDRLGDFSYGLYLYAFPMQQVFASLLPGWGPYWNFAVALPSALLLAILSWRLVEKRALALARSKRPA